MERKTALLFRRQGRWQHKYMIVRAHCQVLQLAVIQLIDGSREVGMAVVNKNRNLDAASAVFSLQGGELDGWRRRVFLYDFHHTVT